MNTSTRQDVRQLAATIESLAQQFQQKLDANQVDLATANELVRNSQTFVFALGGVYNLEQAGPGGKTVVATKVKAPNSNYYNVRDSKGRFSRV